MAEWALTTQQIDTEQELPPAQQGKGRKFYLIMAVAALVLIVAGVAVWSYYSKRESTDDAQVDGHIHAIGARVSGTVIKVAVENNQYVEQGAVLVQLDPKDYQVALDRARAELAEAQATLRASQSQVPITTETTGSQLASAEAALQEAKSRVAAEQSNVEAAKAKLSMNQARLREAQANYDRAAKDLERFKPLIAKEEISRQQYDAAVAAAESARATVEAAQAAVSDAEVGIEAAEARVRAEQARLAQAEAGIRAAQTAPQQVAQTRARTSTAEAAVQRAQAALAQAELNLEYTTIRAPVSGIVSRRSIETGQSIQAGQPVMAVVPLEQVWVTANFKETQLRNMRPGQPAIIHVDAYGRNYKGHVESIGAATGARFSVLPPENASGNFVKVVQRLPVRIFFEEGQDKQHLLRPGMSVTATVLTK